MAPVKPAYKVGPKKSKTGAPSRGAITKPKSTRVFRSHTRASASPEPTTHTKTTRHASVMDLATARAAEIAPTLATSKPLPIAVMNDKELMIMQDLEYLRPAAEMMYEKMEEMEVVCALEAATLGAHPIRTAYPVRIKPPADLHTFPDYQDLPKSTLDYYEFVQLVEGMAKLGELIYVGQDIATNPWMLNEDPGCIPQYLAAMEATMKKIEKMENTYLMFKRDDLKRMMARDLNRKMSSATI